MEWKSFAENQSSQILKKQRCFRERMLMQQREWLLVVHKIHWKKEAEKQHKYFFYSVSIFINFISTEKWGPLLVLTCSGGRDEWVDTERDRNTIHRLEYSKLFCWLCVLCLIPERIYHCWGQHIQASLLSSALKDPNDICGNNCNYLWCYISIYLKTGWLEQGPEMQKHWPETGVT